MAQESKASLLPEILNSARSSLNDNSNGNGGGMMTYDLPEDLNNLNLDMQTASANQSVHAIE